MTESLRWLVALGAGALAALVAWWAAVASRESFGRTWARYATWVESNMRALFLRRTVGQYARTHFGGTLVAGLFGTLLDPAFAVVAAGAALAFGFHWPRRARRRRLARLETQIDPTLRSIAQTLRATSNLVEALESIARLGDPPMSQEIELAVKQHQLGVPLDETLREMSARTGSRSLDAAVTALLIGRATGGNLPAILEEMAAVLRERMRLEAFIDARTAEGKVQAWVMGLLPLGMAALLFYTDPTWMEPMFRDPIGWAILGIILMLEVVGVYWVRKVSMVEA